MTKHEAEQIAAQVYNLQDRAYANTVLAANGSPEMRREIERDTTRLAHEAIALAAQLAPFYKAAAATGDEEEEIEAWGVITTVFEALACHGCGVLDELSGQRHALGMDDELPEENEMMEQAFEGVEIEY